MLRDDINNALKTAMKEQDKARLSTLRLINAAVKDRDIANRGEGKAAVDDAELAKLGPGLKNVITGRLIFQK